MRFLFASTRGAAHIAPLVPFALAGKRAGHDVIVAAPHSAWEHVARAGLPFAGFDFPSDEEIGPIWARVKASTDPDEQNRIVVGELFEGAYAREAYPGLLALARRMRPDAILHETEEHASPRVGEVLGLPVWKVECYLGAQDGDGGPFLTLSPRLVRPAAGRRALPRALPARGAAAGLVGRLSRAARLRLLRIDRGRQRLLPGSSTRTAAAALGDARRPRADDARDRGRR